ncbi:MAG: STAS domain-containing protein [Phycisphaeraceae bacterium]|nr:STAS domain-containing protein [Phycisphaeraceae bacterium]
MKVKFDDHERMSVLAIRGEITADDVDPLRKAVIERMDKKICDFVLDLGQTEFIDSKGLETLLWLQEESVTQLGQVRLAACQETVRKILAITRLSGRFTCCDDVEEAVRSLR